MMIKLNIACQVEQRLDFEKTSGDHAMDLKEKCEEVMRMKGWKNEDLAAALDMTAPNLSSAKAGRRPMPYKALIKLEKLRGVDDHSIIEQLLKTAACVALAVVFLLMPGRENVAFASSSYSAPRAITQIIVFFVRRKIKRLSNAVQIFCRPLRSWRMIRLT